jgi:hypothetical protein
MIATTSDLSGRMGFESAVKRELKYIQSTDCTQSNVPGLSIWSMAGVRTVCNAIPAGKANIVNVAITIHPPSGGDLVDGSCDFSVREMFINELSARRRTRAPRNADHGSIQSPVISVVAA